MIKSFESDSPHNEILKQLLDEFERDKEYKILDVGSGRTSLLFLTKQFYKSETTAIIYPGDDRKRSGIKESVTTKNYILREVDLHEFNPETKFDIVLAHLLLGEAIKFSKKPFVKMLDSIFKIKTDYLVIIDILDDSDVDYRLLLKFCGRKGQIRKIVFKDKYIGFLLYFNR